jgi:hypothetical protein
MTFSRVASLIVAAGYLVAAVLVLGRDTQALVTCVLTTLLPLPFIWFPEAFGNYTGPANMGYINQPTPGVMIAVGAWVVLLVVPPVVILTARAVRG